MSFRVFSLMYISLACAGVGGLRGAENLAELEGLVKTWTGLRQEIASEAREWQKQQAFLKAEISLLKREVAGLQKEIQAFEDLGSSEDRKREAQLFRKQELASEIAEMAPMLDRVEAALRELQPRLSSAGADQLALPQKNRVVDRVQQVAGTLGVLENMFSAFSVEREMLPDGSGNSREMDVLYLGQSQAFAVSAGNDWAAVGVPDDAGWHWEPVPEQAPAIRQVIAIYAQQQPTAFVALPLQFQSSGEASP